MTERESNIARERTPEHPATGLGQVRKVFKSKVVSEGEAFEHLVRRGVARPNYKWREEHGPRAWQWRRVK